MADPARVKPEEKTTSVDEEHHAKTEQPETPAQPEKPAEENKEPTAQDPPKAASVS